MPRKSISSGGVFVSMGECAEGDFIIMYPEREEGMENHREGKTFL
jgi:hypothetical protein